MRRLLTIVTLLALLAAGGFVDRWNRPVPAADVLTRDTAMPAAAPVGALSSSWFCAGGAAQADSPLDAAVVIANPTAAPVEGSITVSGTDGDPVARVIAVPALGSVTVPLRDLVSAPAAAALVDLRGGQVVAELVQPAGTVATPCASAASASWYFADGSTAKDHTLTLALFNPFPEDAIADLDFVTDQGRAAPADFQGIVVPGRAVRTVDVGTHVRRREWVATEVHTRTGRLVASQVQQRPLPGRAGTSIRLGTTTPGEVWWFPEGARSGGMTDTFNVYNPGDTEAVVELAPGLPEASAEPFELTVPARGRASIQTSAEDRIPEGGYAMTVRSLNGVPVVAERQQQRAAPNPYGGWADLTGSRRTGRRWVFAAGSPSGTVDQWMFLYNPGPAPATATIRPFLSGEHLAVEGLADLAVPAAGYLAVSLAGGRVPPGASITVESDEPLVIQRGLYAQGAGGFANALGIPLD